MHKKRVVTSTGTAVILAAAFALVAAVPLRAEDGQRNNHPAVGSWFGRAVELCRSTDDPIISCNGLIPAFDLYMTPTLTSDGLFIGNDSLSLGGPPFAPHTTAHGEWVPNGKQAFIADYVFMLNGLGGMTGLRFRWDAKVINATTAIGFVNIYFQPSIPPAWEPLTTNQFPTFPPLANGLVTSPAGVVHNPDDCPFNFTSCPLVFKFTIKRVKP